eukprot:TRINITY_DN7648_c0_g1_i1.p1 TRINITY_DN7648_c0_g1~~TRINITY_DN7648_c0_g1_i1.p1  ORF type:complete len:1012 (-),score=254.90 TRINITY_DN7648_c0_g1_i1:461-3496(-)
MAFQRSLRVIQRTLSSIQGFHASYSQSLLLSLSSCLDASLFTPPNPARTLDLFTRRCSSASLDTEKRTLFGAEKQISVQKPYPWRTLPPPGEAFVEEVELGSHIIQFETGKLARFAAGSVLLGVKETKVLSTVVSEEAGGLKDFLPLTVDYREKQYAQGRIPNTFMRREGAPAERELLCARVIDRSIRSLFPRGFYHDVQVTSTVLSSDGQQDPDVMAANATSAALMVSDIPWNGPVGVVRIGRINGKFIVNPDMDELVLSDLNLIYTCTSEKTIMIEAQAREISNNDLKAALCLAHKEAVKLIEPQLRLAAKVNNRKKQFQLFPIPQRTLERIESLAKDPIESVFSDPTYEKFERGKALNKISDDVKRILEEEGDEESLRVLSKAVDSVRKTIVRKRIFEEGRRVDGRSLNEVRPLFGEAGTFPALHGSSVFSRGNTQVLCTVTLGAPSDAQKLTSLVGPPTKRFMVHYSFPPFSINEVGKYGGLNRREVGHGTLAEKALLALLPPEHEFPYSVRLNSEVMASDGSTSMATVCGGSLALMDAGIALEDHVAGLSMGLITEVDSSTGTIKDYRILTDILGLEDHLGDMDFKIAGTRKGVTSIQLDIKPAGIPLEILCECLEPALVARTKILDHMQDVIPQPRKAKQNSPRIASMKVTVDGLSRLIGPSGTHIRKLEEETGSRITVNSDGIVTLLAKDQSMLQNTVEKIEFLVGREMEVGGIYKGVVTAIKDFGAFVQFSGGQLGLLHISELSHEPVSRVSDVVKVGQELSLLCIEKDLRGNMQFSLKATLEGGKGDLKKRTDEEPSSFGEDALPMETTEQPVDIDSLYSSPPVIVRSVEECDAKTAVSSPNNTDDNTNKNEKSKAKAKKKKSSSKKQSQAQLTPAETPNEALPRKVEVKSGKSYKKGTVNDKETVKDKEKTKEKNVSASVEIEPKKERFRDKSFVVGDNCTASVDQIRRYGLVLQLQNGAKGMLRVEGGVSNTFKVGEELLVTYTGMSSKGIPVFALAEKN